MKKNVYSRPSIHPPVLACAPRLKIFHGLCRDVNGNEAKTEAKLSKTRGGKKNAFLLSVRGTQRTPLWFCRQKKTKSPCAIRKVEKNFLLFHSTFFAPLPPPHPPPRSGTNHHYCAFPFALLRPGRTNKQLLLLLLLLLLSTLEQQQSPLATAEDRGLNDGWLQKRQKQHTHTFSAFPSLLRKLELPRRPI